MTQDQVANAAGMSRPTYAALEHPDRKDAMFSTLSKVATVTGFSLDALAHHTPHDLHTQLEGVRAELLAELRAVTERLEAVLAAVDALRDAAGPVPPAD